jgi:transposase
MTREEIGRVALRAQMVLLSARSFTAQEIAEIQGASDVTVYKWLDRFDEGGPEGLYDQEREGRPPKLDEDAEAEIKEAEIKEAEIKEAEIKEAEIKEAEIKEAEIKEAEIKEAEIKRVIGEPPTEEGYNASRWTAPRLARHLEKELGVEVHPETVRRALRRLQFSWKRPRRKLPPDPDYAEHMRALIDALVTADLDTTILFEDETELRRFPPLRVQKFLHMWMPVGEQWSVDVPAANDKFCLYGAKFCLYGAKFCLYGAKFCLYGAKFCLYGALDMATGRTITEAYPKGTSSCTRAFVEHLLSEVEGQVLLIWDRARWHTSQAVEELLGLHERIETVLLPKRSPETNPVEDLWRQLKKTVAANLERSLDALKKACRRFFNELAPQEALKMTGLA